MTPPLKYNMTLKEYNRRRAILRALLQVYVDHRTIVEGGLSLVDVSTTLSWSRAQTEALVETLVSEGYLYSTHDTDHYQITCDEMPSDEELSSLVASQGPQQSAPSATAPSRQQPAPPLRRELTQAGFRGHGRPSGDPRAAERAWFDANAAWSDDDARPPAPEEKCCRACFDLKPLSAFPHGAAVLGVGSLAGRVDGVAVTRRRADAIDATAARTPPPRCDKGTPPTNVLADLHARLS